MLFNQPLALSQSNKHKVIKIDRKSKLTHTPVPDSVLFDCGVFCFTGLIQTSLGFEYIILSPGSISGPLSVANYEENPWIGLLIVGADERSVGGRIEGFYPLELDEEGLCCEELQ